MRTPLCGPEGWMISSIVSMTALVLASAGIGALVAVLASRNNDASPDTSDVSNWNSSQCGGADMSSTTAAVPTCRDEAAHCTQCTACYTCLSNYTGTCMTQAAYQTSYYVTTHWCHKLWAYRRLFVML